MLEKYGRSLAHPLWWPAGKGVIVQGDSKRVSQLDYEILFELKELFANIDKYPIIVPMGQLERVSSLLLLHAVIKSYSIHGDKGVVKQSKGGISGVTGQVNPHVPRIQPVKWRLAMPDCSSPVKESVNNIMAWLYGPPWDRPDLGENSQVF